MTIADSSADLEELLRSYRPRVASFIAKIINDSGDVDDLTQETLLKVTGGLENFRGESALSSWILQIASNVCADYFRYRSKRPHAHFSEGVLSVKPASENLTKRYERAEMSECIKNYIDSLPDSYQKVLAQHDIEGIKLKDIAAAENLSTNSVKVRLHRARKKLRILLESDCRISVDGRNVQVCEKKRSKPIV